MSRRESLQDSVNGDVLKKSTKLEGHAGRLLVDWGRHVDCTKRSEGIGSEVHGVNIDKDQCKGISDPLRDRAESLFY